MRFYLGPAIMLDINSSEYRKQCKYIKENKSVTEDDEITIVALGGFAPSTNEKDLEDFYKISPPYSMNLETKTAKRYNIKKIVDHENETRLSLVNRANVFLGTLRSTGCSVRRACKVSGLNRIAADKLKMRSKEFEEFWDSVYEDVTDELEEAGVKRAIHGVEEPVFYQGAICGKITKFSDSTLQFMLQGRRSKVYGRKNTSVVVNTENSPGTQKSKIIMGFEEDKTL